MRLVVVGTSGTGKTYFSARLAAALACPHIELDGLYWGPNWQAVPQADFAKAVTLATEGDAWVADGNYSVVRELLWGRATHIVWLNLPQRVVLMQLLRRTLGLALSGATLYSGNKESLRTAFLSKKSVLWWSLTTYGKNKKRYAALRDSAQYAHLQWIEVKHPRSMEAVIQALAEQGRP